MAKKKANKRKLTKKKGANKKALLIINIFLVCSIAFCCLLMSSRRYEFVRDGFPFWQISLALTFVAVVALGVSKFAKKLLRDRGKGTVIGLAFIVAFFAFFTTMVLVSHLNHIFDFSEPERYTVAIENEDYDIGYGKAPGHYKFIVTIDGDTFDIEVPVTHYYRFREGDLYVVEYHKGAFNEPYYIGVGAPTEND